MAKVRPVPEGFHTVTPYLTVTNAAALLEFLRKAFDAEVQDKLTREDGGVMHAQVRIGDSPVMLGEAQGEWKATPAHLYLYVENADAVHDRALRSGATSVQPMKDEFYGDRVGCVRDPAGNSWWIATRIENLSMAEIERRAAAARPKST